MSTTPPNGFIEPSRFRKLVRSILPESRRQAMWVSLVQTPVIAEAYAFLDPGSRPRRMTRRVELLIEAFPRCGNTYAEAAFRLANGDGVRLSHHLHTPRSVILASKYGTPAILLIRQPQEVLGSYLQFNARYRAEEICDGYVQYHEKLIPYFDRLVVSDFPETTGDFGSVIERTNQRFGTSFRSYVRTPENEKRVRAMIENAGATHSPENFENAVSRPSEHRRTAEEVLAGLDQSGRESLARAEETYARMKAAAGLV